MAAEQHGVIGEISRGSSTATYARHRVRSSRSFRLRCVHRHASLKRKHGYARRSQNSSDSVSSNLRKEKDCGLGRDACAVSRRRGKRKQANQKHRCKQRAEFETKKRVRRRSIERDAPSPSPSLSLLIPPPPLFISLSPTLASTARKTNTRHCSLSFARALLRGESLRLRYSSFQLSLERIGARSTSVSADKNSSDRLSFAFLFARSASNRCAVRTLHCGDSLVESEVTRR